MTELSTHATLLARLTKDGDPHAWRDFASRYADLIRGFARRQGVQPADCDDVLQDVLLALTKAMPGFEYDPARGKFRSYLKTVTIRAVFRKSCQNSGAAQLGSLDEQVSSASQDGRVEELWEAEWRQYHLRQAMRTVETEFNRKDLDAFQAYVAQGREARQVADDLGMTVDQVYQAKSRILRRLEQLIEGQVRDEG